ncbi:antibiotic biosynthesis monooxygenase [Actinocatenispora sera]|jgi:quinol monooxygenase YgiN|uniref:Antibiotic biosynthesis monooxygenase n=1 Tax=Actinocatenispora sera TaxID=390989 RepID=A0A810L0I1_9ACTN|nr:hypothetical protein [Actinocatenispora sera]BCJ28415.1 hypothetical protein Asera_25230 [Actinocatenispora sera]
MVNTGLLVRVEAKPDKVPDVEAMLESAVEHVRKEGLAVAWFALRLGPTTFAIFDAFANEADREAHWDANGEALNAAAAAGLFAGAPYVDRVDVLAAKLPDE